MIEQSRSQRPRFFWLATEIATSGQVQLRKSVIHGLPVALRMPRVKSDKSDWFWFQSIVFIQPFKTRMSLGLARGPDISSAWRKGPLGMRLMIGKMAIATDLPGVTILEIRWPLIFFSETDFIYNELHIVQKWTKTERGKLKWFQDFCPRHIESCHLATARCVKLWSLDSNLLRNLTSWLNSLNRST